METVSCIQEAALSLQALQESPLVWYLLLSAAQSHVAVSGAPVTGMTSESQPRFSTRFFQVACEPLFSHPPLILDTYPLVKHSSMATFLACPLADPDSSQHPMLLRDLVSGLSAFHLMSQVQKQDVFENLDVSSKCKVATPLGKTVPF